ncbi:hypothetical protein AAF712_003532 [Marasmius tenuissimus]|uniref:Uncharacterized protein n=1 Tax=Marasmius tenuissimus TaxID=585030 RepID=A0ABR3A6A1_9AGAR|nr:hypothetical protein PM082_004031 [Marasmius tenuissimus]
MATTPRSSSSSFSLVSSEFPRSYLTRLQQALDDLTDPGTGEESPFPVFGSLCSFAQKSLQKLSGDVTRQSTQTHDPAIAFAEAAILLESVCRRAIYTQAESVEDRVAWRIALTAIVDAPDVGLGKVINKGKKFSKHPSWWATWFKVLYSENPQQHYASRLQQALKPFDLPADLGEKVALLLNHSDRELIIDLDDRGIPQINATLARLEA